MSGTAEEQASGRERPLSGRTAWIISDGKAGHEAQCEGVARALGLEITWKRVAPKGIWRLLAPWGPVPPSERFGEGGRAFAPPWPDLALAAGRTTIPYIRALKRQAGLGTFTVILLDPKTGAGSADLIWVPEHDRRRGENVVTTLASPHSFSAERLAGLKARLRPDIADLPEPRVAVLVGGPNGLYRYSDAVVARLAGLLQGLAAQGAGLMITTSRRTPREVAETIDKATSAARRVLWTGEGENPYPSFLAAADAFVVTADSVNMAGEAAATGKPVHIFTPEGGSAKFDAFHAGLRAAGVTREVVGTSIALTAWSYRPLFAADTIAREIERRYLNRKEKL